MTRILVNLLAFARHAIRPSVGRDTTGCPAAVRFFEGECPRCHVALKGPMTRHRILEVIPAAEATPTRLADPHVTVCLTVAQLQELDER